MCLVCVEWQAGKLTSKEALRNLGEMINTEEEDPSHYYKVVDKIMDAELPVSKPDPDMDKRWEEFSRRND